MNTASAIATTRKPALTIGELISRYKLSNIADGKSPRTVKWYDEILGSFYTWIRTNLYHDRISALDINSARNYILYLRDKPKFRGHPYTPEQDEPVSPRTVQCHVRALKAFASWLYTEGLTPENRLVHLKLPRAPVRIIQPLSSDEIRKIVATINKNSAAGWRNYALLITLLDTGLRASELANINLNQVNFEDGYITVMGKGAKERIVPIGRFVQRILLQYCKNVRTMLNNGNCDALFLSHTGRPITVNTIKLAFSRLAKSSDITRLHAHLCRHTFAINYLLNGGDIFSLQEILGHTTLDMVRHYLHFSHSQIVVQQHEHSPMDKMYLRGKESQPDKSTESPVGNDASDSSNSGIHSAYFYRNSRQSVCHH